MTKKHLTIDELVDRLYGVGTGDHLNSCDQCSQRFQQLRERREMAAEPVPASYEFLAAQRRDIYARMGERPRANVRAVFPLLPTLPRRRRFKATGADAVGAGAGRGCVPAGSGCVCQSSSGTGGEAGDRGNAYPPL